MVVICNIQNYIQHYIYLFRMYLYMHFKYTICGKRRHVNQIASVVI